ncbi:YshB family small membrane protein [Pantoea sp. A4]|nr:YshB family small membrane protein [Pantoea sp. A4]
MFETFIRIISHDVMAIVTAASHAPQTAIAALMCAIMFQLFQ